MVRQRVVVVPLSGGLRTAENTECRRILNVFMSVVVGIDPYNNSVAAEVWPCIFGGP